MGTPVPTTSPQGCWLHVRRYGAPRTKDLRRPSPRGLWGAPSRRPRPVAARTHARAPPRPAPHPTRARVCERDWRRAGRRGASRSPCARGGGPWRPWPNAPERPQLRPQNGQGPGAPRAERFDPPGVRASGVPLAQGVRASGREASDLCRRSTAFFVGEPGASDPTQPPQPLHLGSGRHG